jgi:hypothetical protein
MQHRENDAQSGNGGPLARKTFTARSASLA